MSEPQKIIETALKEGRTTLSEYESKLVLTHYQIPIAKEKLCKDTKDLKEAAREIGFPMVLKGNAPDITHKTEKDLIRLDIRNEAEAGQAFNELLGRMNGSSKTVLVQEMIKGKREFLAGLTRDPQFGPCVMFGLGGIFTEILKDVSFRVAPFDRREALEMMAVDKNALGDILVRLGQIGLEQEKIKEIDINPLIISGARPVAVDALIVLVS
jgi:acyl-CoA synthetase (NDP forming)